MVEFLIVALALAGSPGVEPGTLRIATLASVEVYWESVPLGLTDNRGAMIIEGIPPGPYNIELSKTGMRTLALEVHIVSGLNSLAIELESAVRSTARTRVLSDEAAPARSGPGEAGSAAPLTSGQTSSVVEDATPAGTAPDPAPANRPEIQDTVTEPPVADPEPKPTWSTMPTLALGLAVLLGILGATLVARSRARKRRRRRRRKSGSSVQRLIRRGPVDVTGGSSDEGALIDRIRERERALETLGGRGSRPMKDVTRVPTKDTNS